MYSLYIDTHDKKINLVLYKDDEIIDKESKDSFQNQTEYTMPLLKSLLERNNLDVHVLNEILVVNGPGSFTGVRLGVIVAKTLAYTLNIPIKVISSLEAISLSSDKEFKLPIIRDVKGVFGSLYDKEDKVIIEPFYKNNLEFAEFIKENNYEDYILENIEYDYKKIKDYFKTINNINPHQVNPIYIKVIEVLKNDKSSN